MTNPKIAVAQVSSVKGDAEANVLTHLRAIDKASELGVSYIVFPELSLTGYEPTLASELAFTLDDQRLQPLRTSAIKNQIHIGVGVPLQGEGGVHIALLVISPDGSVSSYSKIHLHHTEEKYFISGDSHLVSDIDGVKVGNAICIDTSHPNHIRSCANIGMDAYIAGVLITEGGYDEDTTILKGYSQKYDMLVGIANHNQSTGGWEPIGRSAIWSRGILLASANETQDALIVAEKNSKGWNAEVIGL